MQQRIYLAKESLRGAGVDHSGTGEGGVGELAECYVLLPEEEDMTQEKLEEYIDRYGFEYILEINDVELWEALKILIEDGRVKLNDLRK